MEVYCLRENKDNKVLDNGILYIMENKQKHFCPFVLGGFVQ